MLEISDLGRRGIVITIYIAKTKALINCAVNVQLICAFVFGYAKGRISHEVAQMTTPCIQQAKFQDEQKRTNTKRF